MLKFILVSLVAVVAVFLIVVALQPADFRVARSVTIAAPPVVVFGHVNDFHRWEAWSPWAKLDPNSTVSFDGPQSGPGAQMTWNGNKEVGEGTMTITESRPGEHVGIRLDFRRPFAATNTADFTFASDKGQTVVTWAMSGKNNFLFKAVGLFMNCDKMVGPQFEKGLASLKSVSEAGAKK